MSDVEQTRSSLLPTWPVGLTRSSVQAFSLAWAEPFGRLLGAMAPCRSLRMSRKFWSLETKTQIQKALWSFVCSACWLWACPLSCLINSFFFLAIVKMLWFTKAWIKDHQHLHFQTLSQGGPFNAIDIAVWLFCGLTLTSDFLFLTLLPTPVYRERALCKRRLSPGKFLFLD